MKKKLILKGFFLTVLMMNNNCFLAFGQKYPITQNEQKEDLDYYFNVLEEKHIDLFRYLNKEDYKFLKDSVLSSLPDTSTKYELYKTASYINANIACGHSKIKIPESWLNEQSFFPFTIFEREHKVFINRNLSNYKNIKNVEILSINGKDIDSLFYTIFQFVGSDGYNTTRKSLFVQNLFPLYYNLFIERDSIYEIVILNNKKQETITVIAESFYNLERISIERYPKKTSSKIIFSQYPDSNLYYLKIKSLKLPVNLFNKQMDSIFSIIAHKENSNLIVDLRGNNGGKIENQIELFSYLIKEKKRNYLKREYVNDKGKRIRYGKFRHYIPNKKSFKGSLYFLIDGYTFSAASELMAMVKYYNIGYIVGEESGGAAEGTNYGLKEFTMPNSKIKFTVPNHKSIFRKHISDKGRGVYPDYVISPSKQEILNNTDASLNYVIKLINQ